MQTPPNHPIQRIWRDNERSRSLEGSLEMAREGDSGAHRRVLSIFVNYTRTDRLPPKGLLQYVGQCTACLLAGDPVHATFRLTSGSRGRPSKNHEQRVADVWLCWHVAKKMEQGLSLELASEQVAAEQKISDSLAKKAYVKYILPQRSK